MGLGGCGGLSWFFARLRVGGGVGVMLFGAVAGYVVA